jgi:hypothetical protein
MQTVTKLVKLSALLIVVLFVSTPSIADLYKCTQSNGKVELRDTPCSGSKQKIIDDSQANAKAKVREQEATCKTGNTDCCFNAGANMAKVYMSNFRLMASNGVLASNVMEQGCSKESSEDCRQKCKTGFKVEAKDALK